MNQNYRFMELSQFGTPLHWSAHGVVGGASAEAQGGKFGQGFISSAFTKAVSTQGLLPGKQGELSIERLVGHAVVGGTASELSGGKFANGAQTAAYGYLFNEVLSNPTGKDIRGCDDRGCGEFGANREGKNGIRYKHKGADFITTPGQDVRAISDGTVDRIITVEYDGIVYHGIVVGDGKGGTSWKVLYIDVSPSLKAGSIIKAGQFLGTAQSLQAIYPNITDHVHVKLRINGKVVDPAKYIPLP